MQCCCAVFRKLAGRTRWAGPRRSSKRSMQSGASSTPIRNVADEAVDTSQHNVHELRAFILSKFERGSQTSAQNLMVSFVSFGYRNGVPLEADLVFDVRFLPNPHFIPEFRPLTGKHPQVAQYIRQFPQTGGVPG